MAQQQQQPGADPSLDPTAAYVNMSCFDLLLIELVPLAERMAREYEASLDRPSLVNRSSSRNANANVASTTGGAGTAIAGDGQPETELFKETMYYRLETLGYRVGLGLSERFSRDRPRFTDQLDVIKFLCKNLWLVVFKKQIDNLKTNHRVCLKPPRRMCDEFADPTPGRFCFDRQQVQTILKDEYVECGRGLPSSTAASDFPVRHHSRRISKSGHRSYGPSRNSGPTYSNFSDQDGNSQTLRLPITNDSRKDQYFCTSVIEQFHCPGNFGPPQWTI